MAAIRGRQGLNGRCDGYGKRRCRDEGQRFSFDAAAELFHATTASDIVRMKGVPIGKRDYMGQMRLKS